MQFNKLALSIFVLMSINSFAQNSFIDNIYKKKQITIEDIHNSTYTGDLFSIKESQFLLGNSTDSIFSSFNLSDINKVSIKGGGGFFKGALIGFAAGSAFTAGILLGSEESEFGYLFVLVVGEAIFAIPAGIALGTLSELNAINIEFENQDSVFFKDDLRKYLAKYEHNNFMNSSLKVEKSNLMHPNNQINIKRWKTPFYQAKFDIWFGAGLRQNTFQTQISKVFNEVGLDEDGWIFDNQNLMNFGCAYHISENWRIGYEYSNEFVQRYTANQSIEGALYSAQLDFYTAQYSNIFFADYIWKPVQRILSNRHELKSGMGLFLNKTWYNSSLSVPYDDFSNFELGESTISYEKFFYGLQLRAIYDFFLVSNVSVGLDANLNMMYNLDIESNRYFDEVNNSYIGPDDYSLNFSSLFLWAHLAIHF